MILIKNLSLQYGSQILFDNISCSVQPQDKIGLVGRNGTGKSTLLKIIAGQTSYDKGNIETSRNFKVAYMPQEVVITSDRNVLEETLSSFAYLDELAAEKQKLEALIMDDPTAEDMMRYADIEQELLENSFEKKRALTQEILSGLGFDKDKQAMAVSQLSVGWRMRIVLAKLLLTNADFYLFDEPTNHLDITAKNWFLNFLKQGKFGYLLVCHDRYFLDKACNKTFELSQSKLTIYHGNYSFFVQQKQIRLEHQKQAYEQQQREIKEKQRTIDRFKASANKATMMQSMQKKLDKIEIIELERDHRTMNLTIHTPQRSGEYVLTVKNVEFGFNKKLFEKVSFEVARGDKVALIAPNGTGKTTLFNLIARKLELQKGTVDLGHNVSVALFDQDQERILDPKKNILEEMIAACPKAAESQIRATLGSLLFSGDDIYKKTKVLSGGERNRVAMAKVVLSNANFFLLDEPTNHLDIQSIEVILKALQNYQGTILFVSHDQDFVNKLANKIVELTTDGVVMYYGNYDEYNATKAALSQQPKKQSGQPSQQTTIPAEPHQQLTELKKQSKNIEHKIAKCEQEIKLVLEKMGTCEYSSQAYQDLANKLAKFELDLKQHTQAWEDILRKIEQV